MWQCLIKYLYLPLEISAKNGYSLFPRRLYAPGVSGYDYCNNGYICVGHCCNGGYSCCWWVHATAAPIKYLWHTLFQRLFVIICQIVRLQHSCTKYVYVTYMTDFEIIKCCSNHVYVAFILHITEAQILFILRIFRRVNAHHSSKDHVIQF